MHNTNNVPTTYTIRAGINEAELAKWLSAAAKKYGTFADGRVDYTNADIAPIVMCVLRCATEFLIVKRGYGLADAEGYWSTINGYIDEPKPVCEQAKQELKEELRIDVPTHTITVRKSYTLSNPQEKRSYIVFPCVVDIPEKPTISLDSENTEYRWITRGDLHAYHTLDDLPYAVDAALAD